MSSKRKSFVFTRDLEGKERVCLEKREYGAREVSNMIDFLLLQCKHAKTHGDAKN